MKYKNLLKLISLLKLKRVLIVDCEFLRVCTEIKECTDKERLTKKLNRLLVRYRIINAAVAKLHSECTEHAETTTDETKEALFCYFNDNLNVKNANINELTKLRNSIRHQMDNIEKQLRGTKVTKNVITEISYVLSNGKFIISLGSFRINYDLRLIEHLNRGTISFLNDSVKYHNTLRDKLYVDDQHNVNDVKERILSMARTCNATLFAKGNDFESKFFGVHVEDLAWYGVPKYDDIKSKRTIIDKLRPSIIPKEFEGMDVLEQHLNKDCDPVVHYSLLECLVFLHFYKEKTRSSELNK